MQLVLPAVYFDIAFEGLHSDAGHQGSLRLRGQHGPKREDGTVFRWECRGTSAVLLPTSGWLLPSGTCLSGCVVTHQRVIGGF